MRNSQIKKAKLTYTQLVYDYRLGGMAQPLKARHTTKNIGVQRGNVITFHNFEEKCSCPT